MGRSSASYSTSPSPTLRDVHTTFHFITSRPAFRSLTERTHRHATAVPSLITDPSTGQPSLPLLHAAAHHHPQRCFARTTFLTLLDTLCESALPATSLARIRHSAAPHAADLFTTYFLPSSSTLSTRETQLHYAHRLGIPLPFLPSPPSPHCHPRCPLFPPHRPIPPDHDHFALLQHAIHLLTCRVGPHRHRRHDAIIRLICAAFRDLLQIHATSSERLCASSSSGKKIDAVITDYSGHPPITALDATVSCPLAPSYSSSAALDAATLFTARASEKLRKHLPGCAELGRTFLPVVFTTLLGIGPASALEYLDSIFSAALANEIIAHGTGRPIALRRLVFYQSLQATLIRGLHDQLRFILAASEEE